MTSCGVFCGSVVTYGSVNINQLINEFGSYQFITKCVVLNPFTGKVAILHHAQLYSMGNVAILHHHHIADFVESLITKPPA